MLRSVVFELVLAPFLTLLLVLLVCAVQLCFSASIGTGVAWLLLRSGVRPSMGTVATMAPTLVVLHAVSTIPVGYRRAFRVVPMLVRTLLTGTLLTALTYFGLSAGNRITTALLWSVCGTSLLTVVQTVDGVKPGGGLRALCRRIYRFIVQQVHPCRDGSRKRPLVKFGSKDYDD